MPVVRVSMLRGRPIEIKQRLIEQLTEAVVENLRVDRDLVVVYLEEYEPENVAKSGRLYSDSQQNQGAR